MAPSSKPLLILTVLSLAAAVFAGAALWLPRRRRRASPDSGEAPPPAPHAGPLPSMGTIAGPSITGTLPSLAAIARAFPSVTAIVGPLPVPSLAITLSVMPARRMTADQEITI